MTLALVLPGFQNPRIPYPQGATSRGVTDTTRMRRLEPAPGAGAGAVASASVLPQSGRGRVRGGAPSPCASALRRTPAHTVSHGRRTWTAVVA